MMMTTQQQKTMMRRRSSLVTAVAMAVWIVAISVSVNELLLAVIHCFSYDLLSPQ